MFSRPAARPLRSIAFLLASPFRLVEGAVNAVPVELIVDQWRTVGGDLAFTAIRSASGGAANRPNDTERYWMSGSHGYRINPQGTLTGDPVCDASTVSGMLQPNGAGTLELPGSLDSTVAKWAGKIG